MEWSCDVYSEDYLVITLYCVIILIFIEGEKELKKQKKEGEKKRKGKRCLDFIAIA